MRYHPGERRVRLPPRSFISAPRDLARPGHRKRAEGLPGGQQAGDRRPIFDRLRGRGAAVSFISRQEQDPRAGRFAREQDLRETLSPRAICHRILSVSSALRGSFSVPR